EKFGKAAGAGTRIEEPFQYALEDGTGIRGRIDRMDTAPGGATDVLDFKYSKKASDYAKNDERLQGPLYLLAVEKQFGLRAGAMFYCGLRDDVQIKEQIVPRERLAAAEATARRIAAEVRDGRAEPRPADLEPCRYCTFKDVCRYEAQAAELTAAEGAWWSSPTSNSVQSISDGWGRIRASWRGRGRARRPCWWSAFGGWCAMPAFRRRAFWRLR